MFRPYGITPRARIAAAAIRIGARKCTTLSARGGHDVFLDQHLDSVGNRLKQTEWPDPIRAVTVLHAPENFSLQHRHQREEREKHAEQRDDVDQTRRDLNDPIRRA